MNKKINFTNRQQIKRLNNSITATASVDRFCNRLIDQITNYKINPGKKYTWEERIDNIKLFCEGKVDYNKQIRKIASQKLVELYVMEKQLI